MNNVNRVPGLLANAAPRDRTVAVLGGTLEVHRPLYRHLASCLEEPVLLIDSGVDDDELVEILARLVRQGRTWLFPSNEIALNRAESARRRLSAADAERIVIPGSAWLDREVPAAELSDKRVLHEAFRGQLFTNLDVVPGAVVCWRGCIDDLDGIRGLGFPLVVKPTVKDAEDSFTRAFASKMVTVASFAELVALLSARPALFLGRELILQEFARGVPVSWCGCIAPDRMEGYRIASVIRSPGDRVGGTATLARIAPVDPALSAAVEELAERLHLDGIFEIEFIQRGGRYHFFCEINPRPWLQVAAVLGPESSIFTSYLERHGFHVLSRRMPEAASIGIWGSAHRYLALNGGRRPPSLRDLFRTLHSDVRLGPHFSGRERLVYLATAFLQLVGR